MILTVAGFLFMTASAFANVGISVQALYYDASGSETLKQSFNKITARRIDYSRRLLKCLRSTLPVNLPNRAKQVAADVAPRIWPPEKEQYDKENVNRRVTARRDPCRRHAKQSHRRFRL